MRALSSSDAVRMRAQSGLKAAEFTARVSAQDRDGVQSNRVQPNGLYQINALLRGSKGQILMFNDILTKIVTNKIEKARIQASWLISYSTHAAPPPLRRGQVQRARRP
jgi:hypothetical protein